MRNRSRDSNRVKAWWYKNGTLLAYFAALIAWVVGLLVAFFALAPDNPPLLAAILGFVVLLAVEVAGVLWLDRLFKRSGIAEAYWRPHAAVLGEWVSRHGGSEDPMVAQAPFNRRVVRGAVGDQHRTVWSAHGVAHGYAIRLLIHGVSGYTHAAADEVPAGGRLPRLHYTLMVAETGVALPYTVVAAPRSDPFSLLPPTDTPHIEFESFAFNDWWEVLCLDPRTGHGVFDPRTIEMLLELHATDIRVLWEGTSVVVAREGVEFDGAELDRWLALVDRMVRNGRVIGGSRTPT